MEDTHWLQEEKATLEGIVKSHDELLMEVARETGLNHMGEDEDDEEEEEDAAAPHAATPEEIDEEGPVEVIPEQEPQCRMRSSQQMLSPWCHISVSTMHS
jgi:hypothetical protein